MNLLLRAKLLTLSGVLALGGLASVAPSVVHAGGPSIVAYGGPAQVMVAGTGFTPGATIEMDVINPLVPSAGGPAQIVNVPDSRFIIADPCGVTGVGLQNRPCGQDAFVHLPVPDFTGKVEVSVEQCGAACGDPTRTVIGPVVTVVTVLPPAQLQGQIGGPSAGGAPLPCGVSVEGSGFGINFNGAPAQQDVQVWITGAPVPADQLVPNVLNREQLMPPVTMQTDAAGNIQNLSAFSLNFIPVGATLTALPGIGEPVSITLTGTCGSPGPGQASAGQIGSATGGAGQTSAPTGGGTVNTGPSGPAPRGHAAE
jgi:hypothetical protein